MDLLGLTGKVSPKGSVGRGGGGGSGGGGGVEVSPEDRKAVEAYHHSISDDVVDCDLIHTLCLKIHTDQAPGTYMCVCVYEG